jgi:hypothetical protein
MPGAVVGQAAGLGRASPQIVLDCVVRCDDTLIRVVDVPST